MKFSLRLLYLYLFSFVGLIITVIGSIQILDLAIKTYVFKVADYTYIAQPVTSPDGKVIVSTESAQAQKAQNDLEQANQRKRQLSTSLSMIFIGIPLYFYHWTTIKKENRA